MTERTGDEMFVLLLTVAREDEQIGKFLKAVVQLTDFERKSLVNTFISEMALKGAPAEFIQAIAALRDPRIIETLRTWLAADEAQDS